MKKIISVILALSLMFSLCIPAVADKTQLGDVNGDGNISAVDARIILQVVASLTEKTEYIEICGDVNGDGNISAVDARIILQMVAGIIPVPEIPNDELVLLASKTKLQINNEPEKIYITMTGGERLVYDIEDTDVVYCEWGEWDGDTIPLTLYPVSKGQTTVKVYIEGYDECIQIDVSVGIPLTTLTIVGVGEEFEQHTYSLPNTNKLHSATYEIKQYSDDEVSIWVDFIVSCIECVEYTGYIRIRYNLYNSSGVVVKTGLTITEFTDTHTKYADTLVFSGLPADDYKLVFSTAY